LDPSSVREWLESEIDGSSSVESLMEKFGRSDQDGSIPKAGKFTYLVIGRKGRKSEALSDVVFCRGDARDGRNSLSSAETVLLPIKGTSVSFRRVQQMVEDDDEGGMYSPPQSPLSDGGDYAEKYDDGNEEV
jgi:hypothetical protein